MGFERYSMAARTSLGISGALGMRTGWVLRGRIVMNWVTALQHYQAKTSTLCYKKYQNLMEINEI